MFRWYPAITSKSHFIIYRFLHRKTRILLPSTEPVLVFYSEHHDPYLNLAYENWMYENLDVEKQDILFFWRNSPCVVVGRHQNPWLECDGRFLKKHGIELARRYSGGGAVYHDLGNLNVTFLTSRARYNRRRNLEIIADALYKKWDLNVDISPRDDLLLDGLYKVSGSAAKLGKYSSYHHCTLLCEANIDALQKAVKSRGLVTKSRSTQSVPSQVVNLKHVEPLLSFTGTINSITEAYCNPGRKAGYLSLDIFKDYISDIDKFNIELRTWEWIYGKTSRFTQSYPLCFTSGIKITIRLEIVAGLIKSFTLNPSDMVMYETALQQILVGTRFVSDDISLARNNYMKNYQSNLNDKTRQHLNEILVHILNEC